MALAVVIIYIILTITTTSWFEPVLFLSVLGIAILINMGTNIVFGEVSFVTFSVSPILQLAVSLDYAIFLLHTFADERARQATVEDAMVVAMRRSASTIAASATTTLFGFAALAFMQFQIGADLGINLVKGIVFSFATVMVLLPALTMLLYRLIDRTSHRRLMPTFANVGSVLSKVRIPCLRLQCCWRCRLSWGSPTSRSPTRTTWRTRTCAQERTRWRWRRRSESRIRWSCWSRAATSLQRRLCPTSLRAWISSRASCRTLPPWERPSLQAFWTNRSFRSSIRRTGRALSRTWIPTWRARRRLPPSRPSKMLRRATMTNIARQERRRICTT